MFPSTSLCLADRAALVPHRCRHRHRNAALAPLISAAAESQRHKSRCGNWFNAVQVVKNRPCTRSHPARFDHNYAITPGEEGGRYNCCATSRRLLEPRLLPRRRQRKGPARSVVECRPCRAHACAALDRRATVCARRRFEEARLLNRGPCFEARLQCSRPLRRANMSPLMQCSVLYVP